MSDKICSVEGCENVAKTRGLCSSHYHRYQRYGDPTIAKLQRRGPVCTVPGCKKKHCGLGYCSLHYQRYRSTGDPLGVKYAHNGVAKAHPEIASVYYGIHDRCYNKKSEQYKWYGGRGIKMCDRWLGPYGLEHFYEDMGDKPSEKKTSGGRAYWSIDRIDVDKWYAPDNCRWTTWREQAKNQRRGRKTSKYTGVSYDKKGGRWCAHLTHNGVLYREYACSEEEAYRLRLELEKQFPVD